MRARAIIYFRDAFNSLRALSSRSTEFFGWELIYRYKVTLEASIHLEFANELYKNQN